MRWVIYGAGAVGALIGGLLFDAGHDVVLVARGRHLEVLAADGLTIYTPQRRLTLRIPVAAGASRVDWSLESIVLLAVKSHQTAAALEDLVAAAPPETPVVCAQNGVANEPAVLRFFSQVHGAHVMFPATHLEPGLVEAPWSPVPGILDVGRYPRGIDYLTARTTAAFREAGFLSEMREEIMAWKYRKLLLNLGSAVQACCGDGPSSQELTALARAEGKEVLRLVGLDLVDDVKDQALRNEVLRANGLDGTPDSVGSSWQSLRRGTGAIETDYLNGEIVLLGRLHGIPTPVNAALRVIAGRMARQRAEPGSCEAAAILDSLRVTD